jgi:hypothetical protein
MRSIVRSNPGPYDPDPAKRKLMPSSQTWLEGKGLPKKP